MPPTKNWIATMEEGFYINLDHAISVSIQEEQRVKFKGKKEIQAVIYVAEADMDNESIRLKEFDTKKKANQWIKQTLGV